MKHIMLVDDEISIGGFVAELLEIQGYRVSYFVDSTEALKAMSSNSNEYDLLLTDQTMPNMATGRVEKRSER